MSGSDDQGTPKQVVPGATVPDGGSIGTIAPVPEWLGERYHVTRVLGRGGMGAVYLAIDEALDCEVALKIIAPAAAGSERGREQLRDEVRLAQRVTHPNVCRTYDLEQIDGNWLVKMEYVAGSTLAERLKEGPLPLAEAVRVAREVCAGLVAAHRQGVVHRDVKPHNIMLEAATGRVVLMDFGIARAAAFAGKTAKNVSGTPDYMAPEQVQGREVDGRADLYALGCVLYEMLSGERVFPRATPMEAALAHVEAAPPALPPVVPERLRRLIAHLLEKDPARRPTSADEVAAALAAAPRHRGALVAVAAVTALAILAGWIWHNAARARWARETATPEVDRLVAAEDYAAAAALAGRALEVLPGDATLGKLRKRATVEISIESTPSGAQVSYQPYRSTDAWIELGRTPLHDVPVPRDFSVWRVVKPGYLTAWQIAPEGPEARIGAHGRIALTFRLMPEAGVPAAMVAVPGGKVNLDLGGLSGAPTVAIDDFLIDRHEVTNAEYKQFVDAGGYRRPELWKEPFTRDGRPVSWEEAMGAFRDATGRPGPSTWELGTFATDQATHPVAGVSWYEAAAYAAFAGKSLPTVYHWDRAAQPRAAMVIVQGSNLAGRGPVAVGGVGALSGFGTYDMAGNVKEWCLNEGQSGKRYILGGSFGEPPYMFLSKDAQSPWSRSPNIGFRCVKTAAPISAEAAAPVVESQRDFRAEKPVSDEVSIAYERLYAYDRTPLSARVDAVEETADWTREQVSFDAAYGEERVSAYLYLPKSARPPFQAVVFFPGLNAVFEDRFELSEYAEFIPRSGRALLAPVYKGTFERRDSLTSTDVATPTAFWRDHVVAWSKDLGRSLDYLETRSEIDRGRIAYFGFSFGASLAPVLLSVERRFQVAVLVAGGFKFGRPLPEVDPINFVGRVRIPVLMVNGRYDYIYPVETSQQPLFELLGTPPGRKHHVVYETGHIPPRKDVIRESVSWLDAYLGPPAGR